MGLICWLLQLYVFVIMARIVVSWFPASEGGPLATVSGVLLSATEPVLGPLRRALPFAQVGGVGLDLSPLIVILGITVLQRAICT